MLTMIQAHQANRRVWLKSVEEGRPMLPHDIQQLHVLGVACDFKQRLDHRDPSRYSVGRLVRKRIVGQKARCSVVVPFTWLIKTFANVLNNVAATALGGLRSNTVIPRVGSKPDCVVAASDTLNTVPARIPSVKGQYLDVLDVVPVGVQVTAVEDEALLASFVSWVAYIT
jgi:hypothetical protein